MSDFYASGNVILEELSSEVTRVGSSAAFTCKVREGRDILFSWTKDGLVLKRSDRIEIASSRRSSMLSIDFVQVSDRGKYTCIASDNVSEDRSNADLTVEGTFCVFLVDDRFIEEMFVNAPSEGS